VDEFLASRNCLPINAHPYFPIDKAALERWWRTLKEWLSLALRPLEERCVREGRVLTKEEVVDVVAPALRVFLRAYNQLPQAYLEGTCPIERLEAAIRQAGVSSEDAALLRKMAIERKDKHDLLVEIRDGLQLLIKLETMQSDFAGLSKQAIESAMRACFQKLTLRRDPAIKTPYRYLLAVAARFERDQQREDRVQRHHAEQRQREHEEEREARARIAAEQSDRRDHPENFLQHDLEEWIRWLGHPLDVLQSICERRLKLTLQTLKGKLGAAFSAQLAELNMLLPDIVQRINPSLFGRDLHLPLPLDSS
jgi:hypothetical protein